MVRAYLTSAIADAFLLGMATAALAVKGGFGNMCAANVRRRHGDPTRLLHRWEVSRQAYCFGGRRPWACSCRTQRTISPRRSLLLVQASQLGPRI